MRTPILGADLAGRAAIVTGASEGLGFGVARALAQAGASVVITGRREEFLLRAHADLERAGAQIDHCVGSVADPDHHVRVVDRCVQRFGRVDIVVNNAARVASGGLRESTAAELAETFATNVFGPIGLVGEAWRRSMATIHGGVVVNVSSLGAVKPREAMGIYGASKAALEDVTRRLALELAPTVRVNAVAPGVVPTKTFAGVPGGDSQSDIAVWPLGRLGLVGDVTSAVLFLVSDASAWITGQVLRVDGGRSVVGL